MKKHENTQAGLRMMYLAEMAMLGSAFSGIASFGGALMIIGRVLGVFSIAAFILRLQGIKKAGIDNPDYFRARTIVLFGLMAELVLTYVSFSQNSDFSAILNAVDAIVSTLGGMAVLKATVYLLEFNGRTELAAVAKKTQTLYCLGYGLAVLGSIASYMAAVLPSAVNAIVIILTAVFSLGASLVYIRFLKHTYPVI